MSFLALLPLLTLWITLIVFCDARRGTTKVIPSKSCNGRGYLNATDGVCNCIRHYHGVSCQLTYCPHGESWLSKPVENNKRNRMLVPCSNMGRCDELTGQCACRPGYEGRACERLSCPTNLKFTQYVPIFNNGSYGLGRSLPFGTLPEDKDLRTYRALPVPICSGHGRCLTLRDAGLEFNGLSLTRPPTVYAGWDADAIQGCVCDFPWTGYDCSIRQCEFGPDVSGTSSLSAASYTYEKFVLECQADAGYFVLLVMGVYTEPIPYNAGPGLLKYILQEALGRSQSQYSNVGSRIRVITQANADEGGTGNTGSGTVCGGATSGTLTTTIEFLDYIGSRPPMWLSGDIVTTSKMFGSHSATKLSYASSTPVLRFATVHTFTCAVCSGCSGTLPKLFFRFGQNISAAVSVSADSAATIRTTLLAISDFADANVWTNFDVAVSFTGTPTTMCDDTNAGTTEITFYSDYGNIHGLSFVDSTGGKITMTTNEGSGSLAECSNNGVCNRETGVCSCYDSKVENTMDATNNYHNTNDYYYYKTGNSDGSGTNTIGARNDCSRIEVATHSCNQTHTVDDSVTVTDICSGNGYCDPTTQQCLCFNSPVYSGINCKTIECPTGPAWWSEPSSSRNAHDLAPCSNRGICDRTTGKCTCEEGYSGEACQRKDCAGFNVNSGSFCGGKGWCMSMSQIADMYGYTYGVESDGTSSVPTSRVGVTDSSTDTTPPETWDAHSWYECVCSNSRSVIDYGSVGHIGHPPIAPSANIHGIPAEIRSLPGYGGYDCRDFMCPFGNNRYFSRFNSIVGLTRSNGTHSDGYYFSEDYGTSVFEGQLVQCRLDTLGETFQLKFVGNKYLKTLPISINDKAPEIKRKIEEGLKMGNVTIDFPNYEIDGHIDTACKGFVDDEHGGFLVTFIEAVGDVPSLEIVDQSQAYGMTVIEKYKGNKVNHICSGEAGRCDYTTGTCQCDANTLAISSNGTDAPGGRGDCGTIQTRVKM